MVQKLTLQPLTLAGSEVLPLVEGGKGIAVSDGMSAGAWAATGGVGTFSAVNAHIPGQEELGRLESFTSKIRTTRHAEMIERAIRGGIAQARIAYETACHRGRIHMNVLWEMGGVEEILNGILSKVKGLVHGVTCGAGMPFRLAEICAKHNVRYYPIVSSARAFSILWRRAYNRFSEWLGGVVYEDPWLAGGHNGLSTQENESLPESPGPRVRQLREVMRQVGLPDVVPIFMAGGIWCLSEWTDWLDNRDLGAIAFQFGTRPLLTQESPIPMAWKQKLLTLRRGDIALNRLSPTGFPASAVKNSFLCDLLARSERQVAFALERNEDFTKPLTLTDERLVFVRSVDSDRIATWLGEGWTVPLPTPNHTLVFVSNQQSREIDIDRRNCVGCLSSCHFSGWQQDASSPVKLMPDPRSFCIQKSLQNIALGDDPDKFLMFCGHQGYRFAEDPFYANGFIPTVQQLIDRIELGL